MPPITIMLYVEAARVRELDNFQAWPPISLTEERTGSYNPLILIVLKPC